MTLGRVSATVGGVPVAFALRSDRTWGVELGRPIPDVLRDAALFHLRRIADEDRGPSDGDFGPRQLREAAELLGGTAEIAPTPPTTPGTVY